MTTKKPNIENSIFTKIYLGIQNGERVYISKHSWDCGWYWGFGYIGNRNCHFHFESYLNSSVRLASDIFENPTFSDKDWWVIRDLFVQAYALQKVAEIYRYGGHQTTLAGITDILRCDEKAEQCNEDLEFVLNTVWKFMVDRSEATAHIPFI